MAQHNWSPVPLAVCETCSLLWCVIITIGATYLTGWCGWSGWTWVGALFLMSIWSCKYCRVPAPDCDCCEGE